MADPQTRSRSSISTPRAHAVLLVAAACAALAACGGVQPPPRPALSPRPAAPPPQVRGQFVPSGNTLAEARTACDVRFPEKIGNYVAHAHCVNVAVEEFAVQTARYPDLLRFQEQIRVRLSEQIDQGKISPQEGAAQMGQADRLIDEVAARRDASDGDGAQRKLAVLEFMAR